MKLWEASKLILIRELNHNKYNNQELSCMQGKPRSNHSHAAKDRNHDDENRSKEEVETHVAIIKQTISKKEQKSQQRQKVLFLFRSIQLNTVEYNSTQ